MSLHKHFKTVIAYMLIIAMAAGMATSMGGKVAASTVIRVTIVANGGTLESGSNVSANTIQSSSGSVTLPATIPVRNGYWFAGWGASASTTIVKYFPGQRVTSSMTLYAVWVQPNGKYRITFSSNGGTCVGNYDYNCKQYWQFVGAGQKISLTKNKFTAPNRQFAGWSTTPGGPVVYSDGQSIKPTSNMTLYPRWKVPVTVHKLEAQPSKYSTSLNKTLVKDVKTETLWIYENNRIKDVISCPDGYYYSDANGNKLSDSTLASVGLQVYIRPYVDEITIRWAGTSTTMLVYTGLSLASSFDNLYGSGRGRTYPVGSSLGNGKSVIGWKLNGGSRNGQIITPGLRLTCHGQKYTADIVFTNNGNVWEDGIYISATELRLMYEIAYAEYMKEKPSGSDSISSIVAEFALAIIGISGKPKFINTLASIGSGIGGVAGAISDAYLWDSGTKDRVARLESRLNGFVGAYTDTEAWRNKVFHVRISYTNYGGYLIPDTIQQLP